MRGWTVVKASELASSVAARFKNAYFDQRKGSESITIQMLGEGPAHTVKHVNGWYQGGDSDFDSEGVYNALVTAGTDIEALMAILSRLGREGLNYLMETCYECGLNKPVVVVFDNGGDYSDNDHWQLCPDCMNTISRQVAPDSEYEAMAEEARGAIELMEAAQHLYNGRSPSPSTK